MVGHRCCLLGLVSVLRDELFVRLELVTKRGDLVNLDLVPGYLLEECLRVQTNDFNDLLRWGVLLLSLVWLRWLLRS